MSKKNTSRTRSHKRGETKKPHSHGKKAMVDSRALPQTNQPYEQDIKRRIGQFGGAGEPPLMKK